MEATTSYISQLQSLLGKETNFVTNMANTAAFLKEQHGYFWVGFYRVMDSELVLGPFQGPVACTRIQKGKGVCGKSWELAEPILVPDVEEFPGHIACNPFSKSELVIPMMKNGQCIGVLDVDSDQLNDFTEEDTARLKEVVQVLVDSSEV